MSTVPTREPYRVVRAVTTALVLVALPAAGAEWIHIGIDAEKNLWMVDSSSILRDGDMVRAWKKTEFAVPKPYPPNGKLISSMLFLDVINCTKRLVGVKASKLFAADGTTIAAHEDPDERIQWQSVAPDTVIEKAMQFVCDKPRSQEVH